MSIAPSITRGVVESSPATILCIHDNKAALEMRSALLQVAGYRVFAAATSDQAMAVFVEHEVDLVLSDQFVRGVSGAELAIFMKQVRPGVAVVLLSGSSLPPAKLSRHLDALVRENCSDREVLCCI